jgi:hypothetical protein
VKPKAHEGRVNGNKRVQRGRRPDEVSPIRKRAVVRSRNQRNADSIMGKDHVALAAYGKAPSARHLCSIRSKIDFQAPSGAASSDPR